MVKKRSVKKKEFIARQRAVSVIIALMLISIMSIGVLIGVSNVAGQRPEPEEPVRPGIDETPPDISLVSVIQYDSLELAESNTKGVVLSPKNEATKGGVGGNYETRPGKVVRITVAVSDYGKGFSPEAVEITIGPYEYQMEQESGSIFHYDFVREKTGRFRINIQTTDYEGNKGKLWSTSGEIQVRTAPTDPSTKKGQGTKKDPIKVDPVPFRYFEKDGKYYTTDANKAVRDKGRRGDGKTPTPWALSGVLAVGTYYLYLRYVDVTWKDAEGNVKREERIYWSDREGPGKNNEALKGARKAFDDTKDPTREKQLQRQIDEREQREYKYVYYKSAEFTLYNINSW